MSHPWLFYALVFLFGYLTCKTFYFVNSTRKSVRILQLCQLVGLFIIVRALENFHYSQQYRLQILRANDASEQNIAAYSLQHEDEVNIFKKRTVQHIIDAHGDFFQEMVEFTNWTTAMKFLDKNRQQLHDFISRGQND